MTPDTPARYRRADQPYDPLEDEQRRSLGRIVIAVLCTLVTLAIVAVAR